MGNTNVFWGLLYLLVLTEEVSGQKKVDLTPSPIATVTENGSVQLTCTYSRDGACPNGIYLLIDWWVNGLSGLRLGWISERCIHLTGESSLEFNCSSAPDKCMFHLTMKQVQNSQHGDKWKCITDKSVSAETSIYVNVPITDVQRTSPIVSEISVLENVAFTFSCLTSAGRPDATVQWYRDPGNGTEIEIPGAVQVIEPTGTLSATRSTLKYTATDRDTGYEIYCKAYNIGSSTSHASTRTTVNVLYPPVIQALPDKDVELRSPLSVQCITSPGNPSETFYRWTRISDQWSQETQTMGITHVKMSDVGNYTCTAWNVMVPTGGAQVEGRDSETYRLNPVCVPGHSAQTSGKVSTGAVAGWVVAGIEAVVIALLTIYLLRRRQLCRQKTDGCKEEQNVPKQQQNKMQRSEHLTDIGSSADAASGGINDASRHEYEDLDSALRQETSYSAMGALQETRDARPEYINMETYNN